MKRTFDFKSVDQEGEETLEVLTGAKRLNRWFAELVTSQLSAPLLEIGSGIGNISEVCLSQGVAITLSDVRPRYVERLRERFGGQPELCGAIELDLVAPDFEQRYADHLGQYAGIFALNVVEHIEDDALALRNAARLLKPGGKLLILVPAFESLYNRLDAALHHYRRYTRQTLSERFAQAGLGVDRSFYFNAAGIAGWYVSGKLQGNRTLPGWQVAVYDALVPAFKLVDGALRPWLGLSVVAVGSPK